MICLADGQYPHQVQEPQSEEVQVLLRAINDC